MSARQNDQRRIGEIWHAIEQLERRLRNGPIGKPVLVNPQNELEEMAAAGIVYSVQRILEEVVALSDGTKVSFPGYEWNEIRGMRNRLVHDYTGTDFEFVWDAIQHEIPKLRQLCLDFCDLHGLSVDQIAPDDRPRP
ncbi:MAG: DUF86 domain-containing protein [Atopobiaceae bacterium]|nr:DUF86 domain-containing protein [Atopobiaceae bacterium]